VKAVQIRAFGGPDVLEPAELPAPRPAAGESLIRVALAGVNFADTHRRDGAYIGATELPLVPGSEVVGTLERTGERVLAYCGSGGYAEYACARDELIFAIPPAIDDATALALLVQGCTAWHLFATAAPPRPRDAVVVHSAAGGTGSLALQLAREFGAGRVIATASSEGKLELARELGADVAIPGRAEGLTGRLLEANAGAPVDLVLDAAGGEIFDASRAALAPFGRIVVYGISSHSPNELRSSRLLRSSHTVAGFWLHHALERPQMLRDALAELFARVAAGALAVRIGGVYALADAARAHADIAGRGTTGKLLLDVAR